MSIKVLITGGAGFIGSNLAEEILKKRYDVHIVDWVKEPKNIQYFEDKVNYVQADVRDKKVHEIINEIDPDGIIHLAAISRVIWCEENPELCKSVNLGGTKNILESISDMKDKPWLIFGSSREVYGEQENMPVSESFPLNPINTYGIAKYEGEKQVIEQSNKHGFKSIILRFSNVFGNERDILDRVIPRFVMRALTGQPIEIHGGNQIFDFTHIYDTVHGIVKSIDYLEKYEGEEYVDAFHVLTGKPTRIVDLPEIIGKHLDINPDIRYTAARKYDVERFYGNPAKAEDILGYSSRVGIDEGIKRTIERLEKVIS